MRIGRVRATEENGRVRSEATISWEESDRPRAEIFFEASPRRGGASSNDANAFLAAAAIPAFRHGERRIAVEGAVCPRLRDGIAAATALVGSWYGHAAPAPVIEPSGGFSPPSPPPAPRAGVLASGGADSIFSILRNRTELAPSHPLAFREALRVRHLMFPVDSTPERREHIERRSAASVAAIARAAGLEITEITTNATVLEDDFEAFAKWTHGSVLASCAIAAGAPLADATISASHDVRTSLKPWGSHPLIDPEFGTAALEIHHEGIEASRLEKIAAICRWPAALEALYVCEAGPFPSGVTNCGQCEKCLRTRAELAVCGVAEPPTFPAGRLRAEEIEAMPALAGFRRLSYYWNELPKPMRAAGRPDLAVAIERLIARQRAVEGWSLGRGWKGALRSFDERRLGGILLRTRRRWMSR